MDSVKFPVRDAIFTSVTADFGALVVREGELDASADTKPWSSWWYPLRETTLFQGTDGQLSPLEKYDAYVGKNRPARSYAADFERKNLYDPEAASWEGLCNAWSLASLVEPEPVRPATLDGIAFSIGDQKALLLKTYEDVEALKIYGQRYNGDATSVFDDIYPDQFHRFLQHSLFEHHRPFIMDKDPGIEVWNTPVYRAITRLKRDAADAHVFHADTWVYGASTHVDSYDFVGTLSTTIEYTYDLFGEPQADGSLKVAYGSWTGDSVNFHPDFVTPIPDRKVRGTRNREIDPAVVDEILARARK